VTLALTVINPALMYVGTAMASIPVIIHLLNRLRFKRVVWAAMEFLLAAHRKNARRVRIEQIILLIVRTLILLLLAAAVARPILEGLLASLGSSSVHRILVVDDSFSMDAQAGVSGEKTAMKQAVEAARELMKRFEKNDGLSLIVAGSYPHTLIGGVSYHHEHVLAQIEKLKASDSATDMVGALEAVRTLVNNSKKEQKIVYILTDNNRVAWRDETGKTLRNLAAGITEQADLVVVDFGRGDRGNLSIDSFEPLRDVVTQDVRSVFELKVTNHGQKAIDNVTVNVSVDGEQKQPVVRFGRIPPGKSVTRSWTYRFAESGDHRIQAQLKEMPGRQGDAIAVDSRRHLAVTIKKSLNVLLVDGEPAQGVTLNETAYAQLALDPRTRDQDRETIFLTTWIRDSEFDKAALNDTDVVLLANVGMLNAAQHTALSRFVRDGGSLIVFLGDQVQVPSYNSQLYDDGKGLLPAFLARTLGTTEAGKEEQYTSFDPEHSDHAVLNAFRDVGSTGGLDHVRIAKYFQLKVGGANTGVILNLKDGNPGVVEKAFGRGKVVLFATTADDEWSNFPRLPGYLELMHEVMDHVTPDVMWRYNRLVDGQTSIPVATAKSRDTVTLTHEKSEQLVTLTPDMLADDRFMLNVDGLTRSGFYSLSGAGLDGRLLSVNVDTRESTLSRFTEEELKEHLGHVPIIYKVGMGGLQEALEAQQSTGGWAKNLLYAMLALLLTETFLAWFFNRES
jgi:VWA domain-containing protein/aerotolerance regulator-like protein